MLLIDTEFRCWKTKPPATHFSSEKENNPFRTRTETSLTNAFARSISFNNNLRGYNILLNETYRLREMQIIIEKRNLHDKIEANASVEKLENVQTRSPGPSPFEIRIFNSKGSKPRKFGPRRTGAEFKGQHPSQLRNRATLFRNTNFGNLD